MLTTDSNDASRETLARLIRGAMDHHDWNVERVAAEAKRRGFKRGFSPHNIRDYLNRKRDNVPVRVIRNFATVLRANPDVWLQEFHLEGHAPLLLAREAVLTDQDRLTDGDGVILVSSRAFLEATDAEVAQTVLRHLDRGVAFTYYFPGGSANPHGEESSQSYRRFCQQHVATHRFTRPPLLFGHAVEAGRFPFFSALHTIVRHAARPPGVSRTYAYIEPASGDSGRVNQAWYLLPESVWRRVVAGLHDSRNVAGDNLPLLPLNPLLPTVRKDYVTWFMRDDSVERYDALRPVLGHAGDRCVRSLLTEVGQTRWAKESLKYLDVGCGNGLLTRHVAEQLAKQAPVRVLALDVSGSQLRRVKSSFKNVKRIELETTEREFESFHTNETFDLITAIHSLYTVDESYVRRIYELLSPRGIACIWMARKQDNVVTAVCDAVDSVLRPGQQRNAAEDLHRYASVAGLAPKLTYFDTALPRLLDAKGMPTAEGQAVIDFCALQPLKRKHPAWQAAANALRVSTGLEGGGHPLSDGLIVIQRP